MNPNAVFDRAVSHHRAGRLDEAAALYDQILAVYADHADTLNLRAVVDLARELYPQALERFDRVIALMPDFAAGHAHRAAALLALGRYEDAALSARRALALDPDSGAGRDNLAAALAKLEGRLPPAAAEDPVVEAGLLLDRRLPLEALAAADRALGLAPLSFDALFVRARALEALKRYAEAIAACDRALEVDPDSANAYALRGLAFMGAKQPERALADFEGALALDPDMDLIAGEAMLLSLWSCEWDEFERRAADLFAGIDAGKYAAQPFVLSALSSSPVQQKKAAIRYFSRNNPVVGPPVSQPRVVGRKIRIGYFSSDLHEHPVGQLAVGLLEMHDRAEFEILGFSFGGDPNGPTRRRIAAACDRFFDCLGMQDAEIARLAREKQVHIAIDLNGYTALSRPGIFAAGAAPIQVNYLGYPATMGSSCHHYIIGDRVVTPPEHYDGFSECVVTMPDTYLVTNNIKGLVPARLSARAELGIPETAFVFCCFNATFKITPDAFASWMRILAAVDDGILWLSDPGPTAKRNLRREARERGVSPDRLIFAARTIGLDYLARYRVADVFLDTFYYNAHATASEALMVGLPVVTRLGCAFAGRVAASLLSAVGMPELIAADTAAYERIALDLARDPSALSAVKEKLASNAVSHPLFDAKRYARNLETAFREMWARQEQGLAPAPITVR
ncbi:MAG: tetratricopeptide repeat protein [Rhodospirillaceae bacterium]|nr:tetratricopeptide repeat protein [Rhodospirillaceae bacterium]